MSVAADIVGGQIREDGTGRYVTRIFRFREVQATGSRVPIDVLTNRNLPGIGDAHPWDSSMRVISRSADWSGNSRNQLDVRVEYGPPSQQGADAQVGSVTRDVSDQVITEVTTEDINGTVMKTVYVSGFSISAGSSSIEITTLLHEVEIQRPTFALVWRRLEDEWIWPKCKQISGHTNAGPFMGEPRDVWLMNVRSSQQQEGRHQVEYTAAYNAEGWQATVIHNENGRIPLDASSGNGIAEYQVYKRADFRSLGLPE